MDALNRELAVSYVDIAAAAEKLRGIVHRTPALTSRTVDERTGAKYLSGAKTPARGRIQVSRANTTALSNLNGEQKRRGVITFHPATTRKRSHWQAGCSALKR